MIRLPGVQRADTSTFSIKLFMMYVFVMMRLEGRGKRRETIGKR